MKDEGGGREMGEKEVALFNVFSQFVSDRVEKGIAQIGQCKECEGIILMDGSPPKQAYHSHPYCDGWTSLSMSQN